MLRRRSTAAGIVAMLLLVTAGGCAPGTRLPAAGVRKLPTDLVPGSIGAFTFKRETAAEHLYAVAGPEAEVSSGLVYSIHHGEATDGAIQVALFKPDINVDDLNDESNQGFCAENPLDCQGHQVLKGIQQNLGSGHFHRLYYQHQRAYAMSLSDQTIYLWFPPRTNTMVMLILIGQATAQIGDALFNAVLDYQHHRVIAPVPVPSIAPASPVPGRSFGPAPGATASPGAP
jgi:hypothetical protein